MGGFVGCAGLDAARGIAVVESMLLAECVARAPVRGQGSLVVFGARDVELAEVGDGALALVGYARQGARRVDAAALLKLWRAGGVAALEPLAGEYVIAVREGRETIVARDRYGSRPLYVASLPGGGVAFATSMGPLVAAGVSPEADRDGVVQSLILGYVPAPQTALLHVRQLGPGEAWTLAPRRRKEAWYVAREKIDPRRTLAAAARALDRAVTRAVTRALPPSGRVGAFLSGGLDSSLVLARAHEAGCDVDAYTLHFGDDLPSELPYARAVADHLGVRHHVLELDARRFCDALEPSLVHLEDLLSEPIAVPNFLLAREASRSCDLLLTGEGGDPSFGGPKNIGMALAYAYGAKPPAPTLAEAYLASHHHLGDDLDAALAPEWRASFDRAGLEQRVAARIDPSSRSRAGARRPGETFVGRLMCTNIVTKGGNNILVKVAKMVSAAHDVALRSPLFDREVVELALTIPPWQKLSGTEEKLVLKRAAARSLPRGVIDRSKRGMAVPLSAWLRGELGVLAKDVLTERSVRERGLFRWPYVERLLRHERQPTDLARSRSAEKLWLVLIAELHQRAMTRLGAARRAA